MAETIEIRPLVRADDRSGFSCGEPALDRFFEYYAGQNQFKLNLAVTYVAVTGHQIVGFATVASGSLERRELPDDKLRRRLPEYPLPILRLARLGVEERARGVGIGRALIRHVFELAVAQRDSTGCLGVVVDAKADSVAYYEQLGFVALHGVHEGHLHGQPTPMFLDIRTIAAARNE